MSQREAALEGIRVLDLTEGIAGPLASTLLSDMGADVVKVERPLGDWGRTTGRILGPDVSSIYAAFNRNKSAIMVDLRDPAGLDIVKDLVRTADVIISNFRPGAMESLGLGHDACARINARVVYCTISAFDPAGGYGIRRGNDTGLQAISGLMSLIGELEGPPMRIAVPLIDMTAALYASHAVTAALLNPRSPRRIEVSLVNVALAMQAIPATEYLATGETPERHGNQNPSISPAGVFATRDERYLAISCLRESHWESLCRHLERPELLTDARFRDNSARVRHRAELNSVLEPLLQRHSLAEWLGILAQTDILHAPVNDLAAFFDDPDLGDVAPTIERSTDRGSLRTIGSPVRLDGTFPLADRVAPAKGSDTRRVLLDLGLTEERIEQLIENGVVVDGRPVSSERQEMRQGGLV